MLRPAVNLVKLMPATATARSNLLNKSEIANTLAKRAMHITSQISAERRDLRTYRMTMPGKDEGTVGEKVVDIDGIGIRDDLFPDINTPNKEFNGVPYKEIPIINIKVTPNNTIMTLTDFRGKVHILKSCGTEGFKTAKKGTNIAAQSTAISLTTAALGLGVRMVRIRVQGLGPGRMAAIKGVQLAGMEVISITDNTHVSWAPPRPRKQRRV